MRPERRPLRSPLTTQRLLRSGLGRRLLQNCSVVERSGPVRHLRLDDVGLWRSARCPPGTKTRPTSSRFPTISARTISDPSRSCCRSLAGGRRTRLRRIGLYSAILGRIIPAILLPILGSLCPDLLVSAGLLQLLQLLLLGLLRQLPPLARLRLLLRPSTRLGARRWRSSSPVP